MLIQMQSLTSALLFASAVGLITLAVLTWSLPFVAVPLAACCGLVRWAALPTLSVLPADPAPASFDQTHAAPKPGGSPTCCLGRECDVRGN